MKKIVNILQYWFLQHKTYPIFFCKDWSLFCWNNLITIVSLFLLPSSVFHWGAELTSVTVWVTVSIRIWASQRGSGQHTAKKAASACLHCGNRAAGSHFDERQMWGTWWLWWEDEDLSVRTFWLLHWQQQEDILIVNDCLEDSAEFICIEDVFLFDS